MEEKMIALIGTVLTITSRLVYVWLEKRKTKIHLFKISELYNLLYEFLIEFSCKRILICKTENGGGKLDVHTNLYVTVLHEVVNTQEDRIKKDLQRILIDDNFVITLKELVDADKIIVDQKTLPAMSLLKDIILNQNGEKMYLFLLKRTKNAVYFMQVLSEEGHMFENEQLHFKVRVFVDKIKKIFVNAK